MTGQDGMTLLYVPAGEFTMGSEDGSSDERPVHTVDLDAFWIDQTEVTVRMYYLCVEAGVCKEPASKNSYTHSSYYGNGDYDHYPVIYVDWNMAKTYCEWADRRLPTEAEWEKAARGTDGRRYPWGNDWDFTMANSASYWAKRTIDFQSGADWDAFWVNGEGARLSREKGVRGEVLTMPVGSFPQGASPYGALDMAGNVAEWVADWFDPNYYRGAPLTDPLGPARGAIKAMRGGSWLKPAISLRTSDRDWGTMDSRPSGTGFRCAKDAF